MALALQSIAMTSSYVPYERPPQPFTLWSAIPRGLQSFIVDTAAIDAKILNDDFQLSLTATLPPNFGYVLADVMVTATQDRMIDWDGDVNLNLQNFYRTSLNLSVGLSGNWVQTFRLSSVNELFRALQIISPYPAFPMIGSPGTSGIQVVLTAWNEEDAAAAAGVVNAFISFWVFDLEQIRKYPINSPFPTHAR